MNSIVFRVLICVISSVFISKTYAATYNWGAGIVNDGIPRDGIIHDYYLSGSLSIDDVHVAETDGNMIGYRTTDGYFIGLRDHETTPMSINNNIWAIAGYGDLVSSASISALTTVDVLDWYFYDFGDGTLVQGPGDFYLVFMTVGDHALDGVSRIGWYHVSVGEYSQMTLLDSGIGINGESILVGIGPIPEPTSGMLLLLGAAALALRRRKGIACG